MSANHTRPLPLDRTALFLRNRCKTRECGRCAFGLKCGDLQSSFWGLEYPPSIFSPGDDRPWLQTVSTFRCCCEGAHAHHTHRCRECAGRGRGKASQTLMNIRNHASALVVFAVPVAVLRHVCTRDLPTEVRSSEREKGLRHDPQRVRDEEGSGIVTGIGSSMRLRLRRTLGSRTAHKAHAGAGSAGSFCGLPFCCRPIVDCARVCRAYRATGASGEMQHLVMRLRI